MTAQYCTETVTSFPSSLVMLPYPQGDCFIVKYGRDVHSYIVGTERKGNQKERKKNIEPAAKKKIEHVQNCREGRGKSFAVRKMAGSMGSPPLGGSCEGCSGKKKPKNGRNLSRNMIVFGGPYLTGLGL